MADITNVDLLFQRKARGIAPLSRFAVQDDGCLLAAVPDEMEARTFHIARYDARGRSQIIETYSVETLRKTEIAASGASFVGVTEDDVYLFRDGRKSRFLEARRASYTDVVLAKDGTRFVAAFSDLLARGHALAFGDTAGRLLWTKDIPFGVTRVAMDRDARHIAAAGESGDLLILDAYRNTLLQATQEVPITALATLGPVRTVYGGGGGVGAVDEAGRLLWFTELPGEVTEVAVDASGRTVAALLRLDDLSGRLVFLSEGGVPTWDVDYDEARPTGLSLSPDGCRCAVSLRDGLLTVYALHYGERLIAADTGEVLAEAHSAREAGNFSAAIEVLRSRLVAVPSDAAACTALTETLTAYRERQYNVAQTTEAVGDYAGADARLLEVLTVDPTDAETVQRRRELRARWTDAALAAGYAARDAGDGDTAETKYLDAIHADPLNAAAREALAAARRAAADAALQRGKAQVGKREFAAAVASLTEAQARGASGPEVTSLLRTARVGEAMATGLALYQDRQYAAALFQFQKVLRLDPENAEAQQKINYARNFLQDTQVLDRFSRLE